MTRYQLLSFLAVLLCFFGLLGACNDKPADPFSSTSLVHNLDQQDALLYTNRAVSDEVENFPNFDIIYEGDLELLLADNGEIDALMQQYELTIEHSFEIDDYYKGLKLQALTPLADPIQLAKALSLVEQVIMIEVGNVPSTDKLM